MHVITDSSFNETQEITVMNLPEPRKDGKNKVGKTDQMLRLQRMKCLQKEQRQQHRKKKRTERAQLSTQCVTS